MTQLRGERRVIAKRAVLAILKDLGGWRSASEVRHVYWRLRWELPELPRGGYASTDGILEELHRDGIVEMKQRAPRCTRFWRVPEPEPVPDTFPAEWTREPVAA